jgi:hypothetical protein
LDVWALRAILTKDTEPVVPDILPLPDNPSFEHRMALHDTNLTPAIASGFDTKYQEGDMAL